ncbi:hypothetical protein RchiOBHm_Chr6g0309691 [Rosa chinensis]|uniref:Uncharacterized protein n=1 Tax=Rosa chinensis TaxID=74649 RepID=A0A2P6Q0Y1_ROSCH|nr:hypothetical protein RchiOBHm_Chr6g0309691 [Rosa chinensis]
MNKTKKICFCGTVPPRLSLSHLKPSQTRRISSDPTRSFRRLQASSGHDPALNGLAVLRPASLCHRFAPPLPPAGDRSHPDSDR